MPSYLENPEFVKRMILMWRHPKVEEIRAKFSAGQFLSEDEVKLVLEAEYKKPPMVPYNLTYTYVSWHGLKHLEEAIRATVKEDVPGDYVETGVWRGGSCILASSIYKSLGSSKKVYACDSFEGFKEPTCKEDRVTDFYLREWFKVSLEDVKENFKRFECLNDNVIFVKGWFDETLPKLEVDKISILRLDGDLYEPTMEALNNLYDKLSPGGLCIVDDYHIKRCRLAVDLFREKRGIKEEFVKATQSIYKDDIYYWKKL